MKISQYSVNLIPHFTLLLALAMASQTCWAEFVYFDGSTSDNFLDATNWTPENAPGTNLVDVYGIDDGLSSTYSEGTTQVYGLRVGSTAKEHQFGETHFGRLTMTGGSLEVIGSGAMGLFGIGREREPIITDDDKKGGEFIMEGTSSLTANGVIVGERTKGLLSIGPSATVEMRTWDTTVTPNQFGGTEDMRIGNYGPAYDDFGAEPGLDGRGLVDVQGSLLAKDVYFSEHGAQGELRLSGGTVNLNGALIMDRCDNCQSDPGLLAERSAKVSIIGSNGTFNVGVDPDPLVVDPMPPDRDILAASPTAIFSFTADAGGVTPITLAQNVGEPSGGAEIEGAQLELNLDAFSYTPSSIMTLIDATDSLLLGQFGTVTFLGTTTADVNYDYAHGDVFLSNFQSPGGIPGDFNGDGNVNEADLTGPQGWQARYGIDLDGKDFLDWQRNYGFTSSNVSAVPEPTSLVSLLLGIVGVVIVGSARKTQQRVVTTIGCGEESCS